MSKRTRSRTTNGSTGYYYYRGNTDEVTQQILTESCEDYVDPGNGYPFEVDRYTYHEEGSIPKLHGIYVYMNRSYRYDNYPVGFLYRPNNTSATGNNHSHLSVPGAPSVVAAATEVAAMTNPSRPLVDFNVFATELKDLPELFLKRSKDIGQDISSGRLSLEFGWKPLIGDLVRLLDFKKEFNKRVKEINSLRTSGLRRKRIVFNDAVISPSRNMGSILSDEGFTLGADQIKVTKRTITGFVKWVPDEAPPKYLGIWDPEPQQRALLALLGITGTVIDASTIWELLPFSWLVDWCSNAGDYLAAHRNTVGAHIEEILIMDHTVTESTVTIRRPTSSVGVNVYDNCLTKKVATITHETKKRTPASLGLTTYMPFLSERQATILSDIVRSSRRWGKMPKRR